MSIMCNLVPVTQDNIDVLSKLSADSYFEMPRSVNYLRRLLYCKYAEQGNNNDVRGYMLETQDGEYVGMLCSAPVVVYVKQERKIAYWGALLGVKPKYCAWLFELFQHDMQNHPGAFVFSNAVASEIAFKVAKTCRGDRKGPEEGSFEYSKSFGLTRFMFPICDRIFSRLKFLARRPKICCLIRDVLWLFLYPLRRAAGFLHRKYVGGNVIKFVCGNSIDKNEFGEFWSKFLLENVGVVSSRDPDILNHFFGDSIKKGVVVLIKAMCGSRLVGYCMARKYGYKYAHFKFHPTYGLEIVDICAFGNDVHVLQGLLRSMVSYAAKHGWSIVKYIGAQPDITSWLEPVLQRKRPIGHPTFEYFCPTEDLELQDYLKRRKGWFFGPFDGNRCLGHGGYID